MITQKITGLLYNCSMNCALPTLLQNIERLSTLEENNQLPQAESNPVYGHYHRLKTLFARYYGIENDALLTWQSFNHLLSTHSFYANEMMLLPIFRLFIAENALDHGYDAQDLWNLKDIQSEETTSEESLFWPNGINPAAGKYNQLTGRESNQLFHHYLGVGPIQVFERENESDRLTETYDEPLRDDATSWHVDTGRLSFYLDGGHFELQPHGQMEAATQEFTNEINALPAGLADVHNTLTTSQTARRSNRGLASLFIYVNAVLRDLLMAENRNEYLVTLQEYRQWGGLFHNDTPAGRQTFAFILLIIASSEVSHKHWAIRNLRKDALSDDEARAIIIGINSESGLTREGIADRDESLQNEDVLPNASSDSSNTLDEDSLSDDEARVNITETTSERRDLHDQEPLASDTPNENTAMPLNERSSNPSFQWDVLTALMLGGAALLCVAIVLTVPPIGVLSVSTGLILGSVGLFAMGAAGFMKYYPSHADDTTVVLTVER